MEQESAAIQQNNKRKKASTIPDEEEENEAAPPKKLKCQTKTQAVSQVSQVCSQCFCPHSLIVGARFKWNLRYALARYQAKLRLHKTRRWFVVQPCLYLSSLTSDARIHRNLLFVQALLNQQNRTLRQQKILLRVQFHLQIWAPVLAGFSGEFTTQMSVNLPLK